MTGFYVVVGIGWIWGWIATSLEVEEEHSDSFYKKILSSAILFFIWPYILCLRGDDV